MELRTLGTSNIKISPIIMGTWQAGKTMWTDIKDDESIKALRSAVDVGINTFDTAESYGKGHSEKIIAKALNSIRKQIIYASKVSAHHLKYKLVIKSCEQSLKNLQTDYLDLYQIHWPAGSFGSTNTPIQKTLEALSVLKEQGKIRAIGVSNFSSQQLQEAIKYAPIDSIQPPYSLFWRHTEKEIMPLCQKHNITILAYSPLAQGLLTGKYRQLPDFSPEDNRAYNKLFIKEHFQRVQKALLELDSIVESLRISLGNLALAWLIAQPQTTAIVGARSCEQVIENAKAGSVKLSEQEINQISKISSIVTDHLDDDPILWDLPKMIANVKR